MGKMNRIAVLLIALSALVPLPATTAAAAAAEPPSLTYDEAITRLIADGYPQGVEDYLCSLGTSPLGFRTAGSTADNAAAAYIRDQLLTAGLVNVRLEPIPVDVWEFQGASVTYGAKVVTASSFQGMQATPELGITAPVVYVGAGTEEDYDAVGDVAGKICHVDAQFGWWYPYYPWAEGSMRGAVGFITTGTAADTTYFDNAEALACFGAYYDRSMAPAVWISRADGDALKKALASGPVTATVKLDAPFKSMEQGSVGYNVVGEIPGSAENGQRVLFTSHHDAYFRGGMDDTSAVSQMLTTAKAVVLSDFKPRRTWTFLFTTAEESGSATAYYDWLYGAWWAIARQHPDWPGTIAGQINLEFQGGPGPLGVSYNPEMGPLIKSIVNGSPLLTPYGKLFWPAADSFNDQFPVCASGVPSFTFYAEERGFTSTFYHTQFDTPALIDRDYWQKMNTIEFMVARQLDAGLLPYDLSARAHDLEASVTPQWLTAAGADPAVVRRLEDDLSAFHKSADAYQARRASIPASRWPRVNRGLLAVEKEINGNFTALDVWEQTIYPFEQVLLDVRGFNVALAELSKVQPNPVHATSALQNVSQTWYGPYFSPEVYAWDMPRHQPGSPQLYFGETGHVARLWNVMPQYRQIEAGEFAAAKAGLQPMRDAAVTDLTERLSAMCEVLERVTPRIRDFR